MFLRLDLATTAAFKFGQESAAKRYLANGNDGMSASGMNRLVVLDSACSCHSSQRDS